MLPFLRNRLHTLLASPDPFLVRFILIVVFFILMASFMGWGAIKTWQEARRVVLTHHARQALAEERWTESLGFLRRVLQNHPDDLEANRLMVKYCKKKSPRSYIEWLSRLQRLEPDNSRTSLELAEIHLRLQDFDTAEKLARNLLNYPTTAPSAHNILALAAARKGLTSQALLHFRKAHHGKPHSLPILANYAAFLHTTSDPAHETEREYLMTQLSKLEGGDLAALRLQLANAVSRNDATSTLHLSTSIFAHPKRQLKDEIQHLSIITAFDGKNYDATLALIKNNCLEEPKRMTGLLEWFIDKQQWNEVLSWISLFPREIQESIYMRFIRLQCSFKAGIPPDDILSWLGADAWIYSNHLRLAGMAQAHRVAGNGWKATTCQSDAMTLAMKDPLAAYELLDLIEDWPEWDAEQEALLEYLSQDKVFQSKALKEMFQIHLAKKNSLKLLDTAGQMHRLNPASTILEGNYLSLALLNHPDSSKIHRACERYFFEHSNHPHALSLQGYSLVLQGKHKEGLALMERIPPSLRRQGPINLYFAHALSMAGRAQEAGQILNTVSKAALLDAELKIFATIQTTLPH